MAMAILSVSSFEVSGIPVTLMLFLWVYCSRSLTLARRLVNVTSRSLTCRFSSSISLLNSEARALDYASRKTGSENRLLSSSLIIWRSSAEPGSGDFQNVWVGCLLVERGWGAGCVTHNFLAWNYSRVSISIGQTSIINHWNCENCTHSSFWLTEASDGAKSWCLLYGTGNGVGDDCCHRRWWSLV